MMTRIRRVTLYAIGATLAVAAPLALSRSSYVLNYTDSVPVGIYHKVGVRRYAGICLPEETVAKAMKAGLSLEPGPCPGGQQPLLKSIYQASVESPITLTPEGFFLKGRLLRHTAPKAFSKTGVPLTHEAFGTYRSGLWAISDFNADSYDSRYFGPVPESCVRYYAAPVLLF
jgi:conjugative transfer signal peptidase TraF